MSPDTALRLTPLRGVADRIAPQWRRPLVTVGLAGLAVVLLFLPDWLMMADQWWNSSTYNHVLFVPLIVGWLVAMRAPQLAEVKPQAWSPGLLLVAGAALCWLLGAVSGLNLARQLGAVLILEGAVLTLLGPRVTLLLLFPLAYALFMVPFGDELVPPLQMLTARITIALTHWSGITASIDGVFIDTPAGLFEVAEACSGVKFLVAMVALGVLVSHLCFVSWRRRALFMAVCVAVPIVANGVRAWGTIYIAQFHGIAFAAGFDHVFYGWVFFALVILMVLGASWRFFDRAADAAIIDPSASGSTRFPSCLPEGRLQDGVALAAIAAIAGIALLWGTLAERTAAQLPETIALPQVDGWQLADYRPAEWWEPRATGAGHRLLGTYVDRNGQRVDVFYALYENQEEGREAGGYGEGALMPDTAWRWLRPGPERVDGKSDELLAHGHMKRTAVTFYRTGNLLTGSNTRLKLAIMRDRLLLRARPTAMLILSAEEQAGELPAMDRIAAFHRSTAPTGAWMDAIAQLR
ncbi:MAG: exosortase A [Novosphingobium sp.]|nr:exosortase A [Novosphingobium sp.]